VLTGTCGKRGLTIALADRTSWTTSAKQAAALESCSGSEGHGSSVDLQQPAPKPFVAAASVGPRQLRKPAGRPVQSARLGQRHRGKRLACPAYEHRRPALASVLRLASKLSGESGTSLARRILALPLPGIEHRRWIVCASGKAGAAGCRVRARQCRRHRGMPLRPTGCGSMGTMLASPAAISRTLSAHRRNLEVG